MKKTLLLAALLVGMSSVANASGSSVILYGTVDIGVETVNWRNLWPYDVTEASPLQQYKYPDAQLDDFGDGQAITSTADVAPTQQFWGIKVPVSVVNPSIGNTFGIKGRLTTSYPVTGFFEVETNPPAVTTQFSAFWNKAFVGLETPFGSLSFGAQDTATKSNAYEGLKGFNVRNLDTIGQAAGYIEPSVKYTTPDFYGLSAAVSYAWNSLRTFDWSNGRTWDPDGVNDTFWHVSVGAKFDNGGPFQAGITYDRKYFKSFTGKKPAVKSYAYTIGAGYDFGPVMAFVRYGAGHDGFGTTVDEALYNLGTFVFTMKNYVVKDGKLALSDDQIKQGSTQQADLALIDDERASHKGVSAGVTFHLGDRYDLSIVDQYGVMTEPLLNTEIYPVAPSAKDSKADFTLQYGGELKIKTNIVKAVLRWFMDANTTFYVYGNYGTSKAHVTKDNVKYPVMKQRVVQGGLGFSYRF